MYSLQTESVTESERSKLEEERGTHRHLRLTPFALQENAFLGHREKVKS